MPIITVPELQSVPELGDTDAAFLTVLAGSVNDRIQRYTKRLFDETTYTAFYSGTGREALILKQYPVKSITSIHLDPQGYAGQNPNGFAANTLLTAGVDYYLDVDEDNGWSETGIIYRIGRAHTRFSYGFHRRGVDGKLAANFRAAWPIGQGNVRVEYIAGFNAGEMPGSLKSAAMLLAALLNKDIPVGGEVNSETLGQYSYSLGQAAGKDGAFMPGSIAGMLASFRRVAF